MICKSTTSFQVYYKFPSLNFKQWSIFKGDKMILESNHGCYGTVYICQFDNEKFYSVIDLKKHIEESIKSRTEVLKEFIDYHCLGIEVLMRTDFPEFTYKFNLIAIELARLIDEYGEVKEFTDVNYSKS